MLRVLSEEDLAKRKKNLLKFIALGWSITVARKKAKIGDHRHSHMFFHDPEYKEIIINYYKNKQKTLPRYVDKEKKTNLR